MVKSKTGDNKTDIKSYGSNYKEVLDLFIKSFFICIVLCFIHWFQQPKVKGTKFQRIDNHQNTHEQLDTVFMLLKVMISFRFILAIRYLSKTWEAE